MSKQQDVLKQDLLNLFQGEINLEKWQYFIEIFFTDCNPALNPENNELPKGDDKIYYVGEVKREGEQHIGFFYVETNRPVDKRRVGLYQIVKSDYVDKRGYDAILVVFRQQTNGAKSNSWRLSFICDFAGIKTNPKRFTFVFGDPNGQYRTAIDRFSKLKEDIEKSGTTLYNLKEAFSVEALSKEFYTKLYRWYEWALSKAGKIEFPKNKNNREQERKDVKLIRLITRVLFVWFIKQKKLVPDTIFQEKYLSEILRNFKPNSDKNGDYYNAILQNLFFATLNCSIKERQFASAKNKRDAKNLYRYTEMFNISEEEIKELFGNIPFLNGGLFECLDYPKDKRLGREKKEDNIENDGFSRNKLHRAFIPNILFFNDDEKQPGLIKLLEQYNFTVEENSASDAVISLDPELLGQVFENLLGELNEETQETARKTSGSFYTPREIVENMVNVSLKNYIFSKKIANVDEERLKELFSEGKISLNWEASTREAVKNALKSVKILDPACGSGAFPVGCLQKIVTLLELLEENQDRYNLKLEIINNCIYGVDIKTIAMLICRLRFFISLICDQEAPDFTQKENNFNINPLPNLETKFVAANTLINADIRKYEFKYKGSELDYNEKLLEKKEELLEIRKKYFEANNISDKKKLKQEDDQKVKEIKDRIKSIIKNTNNEEIIAMLKKQIKDDENKLKKIKEKKVKKNIPEQRDVFGKIIQQAKVEIVDINKKKRDKLKKRIEDNQKEIKKIKEGYKKSLEGAVSQIAKWSPYNQNSVCDFFDPEWMFCLEASRDAKNNSAENQDDKMKFFDIVIGNPPYIQLQDDRKMQGLASKYEAQKYDTFDKRGDIYCLFYERGVKFLKNQGILCYITSNKWMRTEYGKKTRQFLADKTNPLLLIDLTGIKVFESADVDTNILLLSKSTNQGKTRCLLANKVEKSADYTSLFEKQEEMVEMQFSNSDSSWIILSEIEQNIKKKIEAVGTPLKDWNIKIYRGVLTGCNDAFIISAKKRAEILRKCQSEERAKTDQIIRPILRGKDIKKYGYEWKDLWIIYIPWHFPYQFDKTIRGASQKAEQAFQKHYPTIYSHLLKFKEPLLKRNKAETGIRYEWYALQRWGANYWEDFNEQKIIYSEIVHSPQFYFDEKGEFYPEATTFIMTGSHLRYLYNIFHSRTFTYFFKRFYAGGGLGKDVYRYKKEFFQKLPVPLFPETEFYEAIVKAKADDDIEKNIYQFYSFTDEEIEFINKN